MSFNSNSGDEQSEDGELRQSPGAPREKTEVMDFSLSEEDADNTDSLEIKPPQAKVAKQSSRTKGRDTRDRRTRHRRTDRRHDERYMRREKHHRDKRTRSNKEREQQREQYQRDKERYYREKQSNYEQMQYKTYAEEAAAMPSSSGSSRHPEQRRYENKKARETREERQKKFEDENRGKAEKVLQDLRERLLSKRTTTKDDDEAYYSKHLSSKDKKYRETDSSDPALQGEAGMHVREIINISKGDEHKHRSVKEDEKLTDEDRIQQELRKERLLEAEREMAKAKEQSRVKRERRHLDLASKRKQEEEEEFYRKRLKIEEEPLISISDNTDEEVADQFELADAKSGFGSDESPRSSPNEPRRGMRSDESSDSRDSSVGSERRSRSRSGSFSPKNNARGDSEETEVATEKENNEEEKKPKIDEDLPPYLPAIQGCRSVEEFQCLNRIEEGTYGVVYRAKDKRTEEIVALKRLKMEKEKEGFPITSLREINTLLRGQHPNIVTVREIVVGSNMDKIYLVMDYVEHDLKSLMETMRYRKQNFTPGEVKCLLKQLLLAVAHLHDNWILHRDLKTSNLLLSHKGILKVGDFGLAREYGSPLKPYTPIVVTLWYRAPELLLCAKQYSTPIDLWSVGCIFAELLLMNALFPGKSEVDELNKIFKLLGTPNDKIWTGFNELPAVKKMKFTEFPVSNLRGKFSMLTEVGLGMLTRFLTYDPTKRVTAEEAMQHAYFTEPPFPIDPSMFPTWPAKSELGQKRALATSPKPPSGGREYKQISRDDDDSYGFRINQGIDARHMGGGFSLKF